MAEDKRKKAITPGTFRKTVKMMVDAIPHCQNRSQKINDVLQFRDQLVLEMSRGIHDSFNGRMNISPVTAARNIYTSAIELSLLILSEELPQKDDKLDIEEEFDEEDDEIST